MAIVDAGRNCTLDRKLHSGIRCIFGSSMVSRQRCVDGCISKWKKYGGHCTGHMDGVQSSVPKDTGTHTEAGKRVESAVGAWVTGTGIRTGIDDSGVQSLWNDRTI